eukprot:6485773-Amphidinium_carterae.1
MFDFAPTLDRQHRRRHQPLISEFLEVVEKVSPAALAVGDVVVPADLGIDQHARVMDCYPVGAVDGCQSTPSSCDGFVVKLGVFRTEEQWLKEAQALEHPFDSVRGLRLDVSTTLSSLMSSTPSRIRDHRKMWIDHLKSMSVEFQDAEERLHATMPPDIGNVLRGKNLGLLSYAMRAAGCKDENLWRERLRVDSRWSVLWLAL